MNSRDRLETTLNHQEPDRVPIDLGGIVTGITTGANKALKSYLNIESDDPLVDRVQQLAGERLLRLLRTAAVVDREGLEVLADRAALARGGLFDVPGHPVP